MSPNQTADPMEIIHRHRLALGGTEYDLLVTPGRLGVDEVKVLLCRAPFELAVVDGHPSPMSVTHLPVPR